MSKTLLVEQAASTLSKKGKRWRVICATPGQGSSGNYSESVLREYGPAALPAGSKAYINHDEKRDPRDLLGFYPEGAVYEDGVGLVAELEVLPHYEKLVEAVAPHTGMSIYMMGEADEDGNVTKLVPHRTNGCDLVGYPGLEGSGIVEKLYESARNAAVDSSKRTENDSDGKEMSMDEKVKEEFKTLLKDLFAGFIAETKDAAVKQAQEAADADAAKADADARVEATVTALESIPADLPKPIRESLVATVKSGKTDIADDIKAAKALVEEIKQDVADGGIVIETAGSASGKHDWSL